MVPVTGKQTGDQVPLDKPGKRVYYTRRMSQDHIVKLKSTGSKHMRYDNRNKKRVEKKLELRKYDPVLRKHVVYKEVKK